MSVIDAYTQCSSAKCHFRGSWKDNFCGKCGSKMEQVTPLPYIGEDAGQGIYRITIVVEREFRNIDHAQEVSGKSCLGEDEGYFRDCEKVDGKAPVTLEFIRSTVTKKTHPYECNSCVADGSLPAPVSKITEGRCEYCDKQDWTLRG